MFKCLIISGFFLSSLVIGNPETQCPENMTYSKCTPNCPATCEFRNVPCYIFSYVCGRGCVCADGYIYKSDEERTCVKIEECPKTCSKPNFVWKDCGPACHKTCGNMKKSRTCTDNCVAGCFCKEPYIFDDFNKKCILEKDCPAVLQ